MSINQAGRGYLYTPDLPFQEEAANPEGARIRHGELMDWLTNRDSVHQDAFRGLLKEPFPEFAIQLYRLWDGDLLLLWTVACY